MHAAALCNGAPFFPAFLFWKLGMYINITFKSYIMDFNCKQILKEKLFDMICSIQEKLNMWVLHETTGPAYLLLINKYDDDNCKMLVLEIIWLYHWLFTFRYDHSFKLTGKYALKNATIIFFAINTMNLWLIEIFQIPKYLSSWTSVFLFCQRQQQWLF